MVTRVGKFVGGLGQDLTNKANAHATENRIAFGASINPTANVHVVGTVLATTTVTATGGFLVPDDGDIGSASATDAIQISSAGIVTFKDDIKIKDGGTIGTATDPAAITIAAAGGVTFSDAATFTGGVLVPDDGDVGSASATDAIQISAAGIVTFKDDIKIKDDGTIGSASAATAMTIDSSGIVAFVDDIKIKDGGTIGSASDADAITIASTGKVTLTQDLILDPSSGISNVLIDSDGSAVKFGEDAEIVIKHVHDTGLLLTDSGGSPTLQLHDAGESISSDGSKLILTSNSVAFNMPTADGDDGQVLKTDGSGTFSFTAVTTSLNPATILAAATDCGALTGATSDTKDAFGIAVDDALTELDCSLYAANALGTVDMGSVA